MNANKNSDKNRSPSAKSGTKASADENFNKKQTGNAGEDLACEVLRRQGYRIIWRNYRCRYGEIDIIALRDGRILFAEVKTRLSDGFGHGRESVGWEKQNRIRRAAQFFLAGTRLDYWDVQFQVIEINVAQINDDFMTESV